MTTTNDEDEGVSLLPAPLRFPLPLAGILTAYPFEGTPSGRLEAWGGWTTHGN